MSYILIIIGIIITLFYTGLKKDWFVGRLYNYRLSYGSVQRVYFTPTYALRCIFKPEKVPVIGASDGFCYLDAFSQEFKTAAKETLGKYPQIYKFFLFYEKCVAEGMPDVDPHCHIFEMPGGIFHYDATKTGEELLDVSASVGSFRRSPGFFGYYLNRTWNNIFGCCLSSLFIFVFLKGSFWWFSYFTFSYAFFGIYFLSTLLLCLVWFLLIYRNFFFNFIEKLIESVYGSGGSAEVHNSQHGEYMMDDFNGESIVLRDYRYRTYFRTRNGDREPVFTIDENDYDVNVPVNYHTLFVRMRDNYALIPKGFKFNITSSSVDTGHSISTVNNRIVRKIITNNIGAGKRVLHVGENLVAMSKKPGHVCCLSDNEANDASRLQIANTYFQTHQNDDIEFVSAIFQEIDSRFDVVTSIHSCYDIPFDQFFGHCYEIGAKTVFIAMHFHTLMLDNARVNLPFSDFIVDQQIKNNMIVFRHGTTDEKTYHHDLTNYWRYIFTNVVRFENQQSQCYYNRKVIYNNLDVVVFRYDLSNSDIKNGQNEIIITPMASLYTGYYKLDYEGSKNYIMDRICPNMVYVPNEFNYLCPSKQFEDVDNKGYHVHNSLMSSNIESGLVYQLFYDLLKPSISVLNSICGQNCGFSLYEINGYESVNLHNTMCVIRVETVHDLYVNHIAELGNYSGIGLDIDAEKASNDDLLTLLERTPLEFVDYSESTMTFTTIPVAVRVGKNYLCNRMALGKNVRDVLYIEKINNRYYRNYYSLDETNHNIGNIVDNDVFVVDDVRLFLKLAESEFGEESPLQIMRLATFDQSMQLYGQSIITTRLAREFIINEQESVLRGRNLYVPQINEEDEYHVFCVFICGRYVSVDIDIDEEFIREMNIQVRLVNTFNL